MTLPDPLAVPSAPAPDPASMARFIGPECAGTSSLDAGLLALRAA